ncbi:Protein SGT1-like protein B [Raphanus sativus]|uniref:Protein SGT1 homolog B n=1 Tax=Raphanus sativus TaxID=3726 RepID=A0A9W3CH71_RAPSA|nr:protein SGT1 homolog B [Raphanus sativus]KAJ4876267.1 Protein SGT1-like protein B [Raphanus sativus]
MAKELAEKAKEAFLDDDFDVAVDLYSKAIDLDPNCAAFFADRAQANIKILNFTEAVADANKAIELEPTLAKAYLRKGTACMKLEEYSTAKAALEKGASVAPNESKFNKMIDECNLHIAEEEKDLVQQMPPTLPSSSTTPPLATAADSPSPAAPAKPMFRHEFYQKPEEVVVTIFAKGIPKQNVNVEFGDQILSVVIDVAGEEAYHFQPRLFGKIIPEKCRYEVLSTKVEIRLAKAEIVTWASLEYGKGQALLPKPNVASAVSQRPVYPSSKPAKDWDKLEAEVKKQEKDEKLDGDAAMNKFFSDIYQSADEDMRRAMNKSFAESNGTVLSTNWKEVGTKKVESTPPDGMELKKWEY